MGSITWETKTDKSKRKQKRTIKLVFISNKVCMKMDMCVFFYNMTIQSLRCRKGSIDNNYKGS